VATSDQTCLGAWGGRTSWWQAHWPPQGRPLPDPHKRTSGVGI